MYGHQQCVVLHIISQVPGWLACISSIRASRMTLIIATLSSIHTTGMTLEISPICMNIGVESISSAFIICEDAISNLFYNSVFASESCDQRYTKKLINYIANVGTWGLVVGAALIFDDMAGEVGVVIVVGFAVRVAFGKVRG